MAVIAKKIKLAGSKGAKELEALFDSGATYSCIKRAVAEKLGEIDALSETLEFATAKEGEKVEAREHMSLIFYLNGYRFSDEFMVLPDLSERVIIGATTMQKWRFKLDFEHEEVIIDPKVTRLRLL